MATLQEPRNIPVAQPVVNYDEPPVKPPPLLAVGPLAWARKNLFSSALDTILTLAGVIIIISVITGFLTWAISQANWFAITFNLRIFLLGRYSPAAEWRVILVALLAALTVGLALAAWSRIRRAFIIIALVVLAILFIAPPLISATMRLPVSYTAAGNIPIASAGTDTIPPNPQVGFIGKAGETVTFELITAPTESEQALTTISGFMDTASNQLRNNANLRLNNIARQAEIEASLAGNLLTDSQRARLTVELERITIAEPVLDTYRINQRPVSIRVSRATSGEVVGESTLENGSGAFSVTLPEDGWYVIDKTIANDAEAVALIQTQGIFPLLIRTVTRSGEEVIDEEGNVVTTGGGSIPEYVRMTDGFTVLESRPVGETGSNLPIQTIIDNQFRGLRAFPEYLSLFVGPFFEQINEGAVLLFLAVLLGYALGRWIDRAFSPAEAPRRYSSRTATWMLAAFPILMFLLVYGVGNILPLTDTRRWGGLLLTFLLTIVGIIASFPIGILLALGRRSKLPVVSLFSTLYIEFVRGVPLITVLFMAQLLVPLINPALGETPNVFRAMIAIVFFSAAYLAENVRGGLQAIPPGQEEAARAVGLNNVQMTLYITLPQALRLVIPALVGQCISLFKDTSLVAIVGLLDLTNIGRNIVAQTEFLGLRREVFVFLIVIYFTFSYIISTVSRRIEASGAGRALKTQI